MLNFEGQILVESWGYDQTNITFYRCIKQTAKTCVLQRLSSEQVSGDGWTGKVIPRAEKAEGQPFRRKYEIWRDDLLVQVNDRSYARLWNGVPQGFTAYA